MIIGFIFIDNFVNLSINLQYKNDMLFKINY